MEFVMSKKQVFWLNVSGLLLAIVALVMSAYEHNFLAVMGWLVAASNSFFDATIKAIEIAKIEQREATPVT